MADKVYQLPYDDEIDKDISDWLNSLPRSRKAELVRNAIRFYLQSTNKEMIIAVNPASALNVPIEQEIQSPEPKKRPNLPTDGEF